MFQIDNAQNAQASQSSPTSINISEGVSSWALAIVAGIAVLGLLVWLVKRK